MKKIFYLSLLLCLSFFELQAQYLIGTRDTTLIDVSRSSRSIQVYMYYPSNLTGTGVALAIPPAGGFPVVVVAHGFSMDYAAFTNFRDSLVPKGYIVLIPNTETGIIGVSHGNFGGDLSFLVNYMQQVNTVPSSRFYGKVRNKSAIIGHSMGGGATYLGANGNSNVTTTVTFSAAETTPSAVTACAAITVPSLVFAGQNDCVAPQATNQTLMYNALASSCKTKIVINNGGHCQYSNSSFTCDFGEGSCRGTSTILTRAQQQPIVFDYLYKWFDFYLRGNCNAYTSFQNLLTTDTRITYTQACSYALPVATIASDATIKCTEDSLRAYSTSSFTSYTWNNGKTDSLIHLKNAGTYFLIVTDYMGCKDTSNTISISNRAAGRASLSPSGTINICDTAVSILVHATGTALSNYIWNTTDTGTDITVSAVGNYYVRTIDTFACIGFSDTLSLVNHSPIHPLLSPSDSVFICPGDSAVFTVRPLFNTYMWFDSTSAINYTATESAIVYVVTTDSNGCHAFSDTVIVQKLIPAIPSILFHTDSLAADTGYVSYQWYDETNTLVSSARGFIPAVTSGNFYVITTDINGCASQSATVSYGVSVGISDAIHQTIQVYPSPFTNQLTITNAHMNDIVEVYTNNATLIHRQILTHKNTSIDTRLFVPGMYIIKIISTSGTNIFKVVK